MTQLVRYDAACRAVAEAKSVDEVRDIRDKAVALKSYARIAKNRDLEIDAAEIRFRAERRLGEMMKEQPKNPGHRFGGVSETPPATLADMGIDKNLAKRARAYASINGEQFESQVAEWRDRIASETARVETNLLRAGKRAQRDQGLSVAQIEGVYDLMYADPPWRYEHVKTESRAVENQYPTMSLDDIRTLEVPAADHCTLWLWATSPKLAEAMSVIDAWGFTYRTCLVWVKDKIGMGYYARQRHELLLVATIGKPRAPEPSTRPDSVIEWPRGKHSEKPALVYGMLQSMYPEARKVELFARERVEGWDAWGNQVA